MDTKIGTLSDFFHSVLCKKKIKHTSIAMWDEAPLSPNSSWVKSLAFPLFVSTLGTHACLQEVTYACPLFKSRHLLLIPPRPHVCRVAGRRELTSNRPPMMPPAWPRNRVEAGSRISSRGTRGANTRLCSEQLKKRVTWSSAACNANFAHSSCTGGQVKQAGVTAVKMQCYWCEIARDGVMGVTQ